MFIVSPVKKTEKGKPNRQANGLVGRLMTSALSLFPFAKLIS